MAINEARRVRKRHKSVSRGTSRRQCPSCPNSTRSYSAGECQPSGASAVCAVDAELCTASSCSEMGEPLNSSSTSLAEGSAHVGRRCGIRVMVAALLVHSSEGASL